MPMISGLPAATMVAPTDLLLIEQPGGTNSVAVDVLLAGQQPAILAPTGSLLGRVSLGAGSPEAIALGSGLALAGGHTLGDRDRHPGHRRARHGQYRGKSRRHRSCRRL